MLILVFSYSQGQNFSYPDLVQESKKIKNFIPNNWSTLDKLTCDLNTDGTKDYVLVIQTKDDSIGYNPRILAVVLADKINNTLKLIKQYNDFIPVDDSPYMQDPYGSCRVEDSVLIISLIEYSPSVDYVHITHKFYFCYSISGFKLIKYEINSRHIQRIGTTFDSSWNLLTKQVKRRKSYFDSEWNFIENVEEENFELEKPIFLKDIQEPLNWKISDFISSN